MIPRITHSRSRLVSYYNEYEDGSSLVVSSDTYPDLFSLRFPSIVTKSSSGWRQKKMKYLRFPENTISEDDVTAIKEWQEKFAVYVLLGLNDNIKAHFSEELDFCMALDFNFNPGAAQRTIYGEAEYQLKYQSSRPHFQVLRNALVEAVGDLPIPATFANSYCISCIPGDPAKQTIPRSLARAVAKDRNVTFVDANLNCDKAGLKNVSVADKIPIWQKLYEKDCVELVGEVADKLVIVVDDLYQSGVTLWSYAKFLKERGAKHVFGLPCVKSLSDSDNQ